LSSVEINVFFVVGTLGKESLINFGLLSLVIIIFLVLFDNWLQLKFFLVLSVISCAIIVLEESGVEGE
jgi:hypothetical protein